MARYHRILKMPYLQNVSRGNLATQSRSPGYNRIQQNGVYNPILALHEETSIALGNFIYGGTEYYPGREAFIKQIPLVITTILSRPLNRHRLLENHVNVV